MEARVTTKNDQLDVIKALVKILDLSDYLKFQSRKPSKAGRRLTPFEHRQSVWEYWHKVSSPSTLTSRPAKLKISDKNKIQSDLEYANTVNIVTNKRGISFYENLWWITQSPLKLYVEYLATNAYYVSHGTFLALKPFYMRGATTSDLEMYVCKLHLHAYWALHALIKCAKQQQINLDFNCYNEFFSHLTRNYVASDTTIIDWECVPCKKESCEHITSKWRQLFDDIST